METQPFVSIAPWTLIFQIANLLLLMLLFRKFLFKPVLGILEKRRLEIEGHYQEAETAEREAKTLRSDYEGRMRGARAEAEQIVKTAEASAQQMSASVLSEANEQAERVRRRADQEIQLERQKAMHEAKQELSGIALDIASQILNREISEADHKAMIDDFIQNVGEG